MDTIKEQRKDFLARRIHNIAKRSTDNTYQTIERNGLIYLTFNTMLGKESVPIKKEEYEWAAQLLQ